MKIGNWKMIYGKSSVRRSLDVGTDGPECLSYLFAYRASLTANLRVSMRSSRISPQ